MNWAIAGLAYCGLYAALVWALGDRTSARLLVGNAALLLPPSSFGGGRRGAAGRRSSSVPLRRGRRCG